MLTSDERRKLEEAWRNDDGLIVRICSAMKGAVLLLLLLCLVWIGAFGETLDHAGDPAAIAASPSWRPRHEGAALRQSRTTFAERRARSERAIAPEPRETASR